jgi:hypothetical protein
MEKCHADADRLAEGVLIAECIWDPMFILSTDGRFKER